MANSVLRAGKLPNRHPGGRPAKPSFCPKCGVRCESATAAREHCKAEAGK